MKRKELKLNPSEIASMLGRLGKGVKKTITPALLARNRAAAQASALARSRRKKESLRLRLRSANG